MTTAVIIDDEQKNVFMLTNLLREYCPQVTLLGTAKSAPEGKKLVESTNPELIFLDIEMPYGTGFDMLQSLPGLQSEVIFTTAFDQYAIRAFHYGALDYLLKPVSIEQLETAVLRAEKRIKEKSFVNDYEALLKNIAEKDPLKQTLTITDKGAQHFIRLEEIKYIIADGSYSHIHTDKRIYVTTKSLKDFEHILPETIFCRIHHGHIVNRIQIVRIQKGRGGSVCMKDGRTLEISVRKKEEFLKILRDK